MVRFSTKKRLATQTGFTLIEMLIVVIVLAILAAVIIPQFASSTEDANTSSLKADLTTLRSAIELYYHQHNSRYPGLFAETDGMTLTGNGGGAATAFVAQLTQYSDKNGKVQGIKDATFKYGPYIKTFKMPANPFMDGATANAVTCDIAQKDITVAPTADGTTGWKFYVLTGRFVANDNITLSDGTTKTIDF